MYIVKNISGNQLTINTVVFEIGESHPMDINPLVTSQTYANNLANECAIGNILVNNGDGDFTIQESIQATYLYWTNVLELNKYPDGKSLIIAPTTFDDGIFIDGGLDITSSNTNDGYGIKLPDNSWIMPQTAQQPIFLTNGTTPNTVNSTLSLYNGSTLISAGDGTTQFASLQMDASNITLLQSSKPILDATPTETTLFNPTQASAFQIDSTYNWNYLTTRFTVGIDVLATQIGGAAIKIPDGSWIQGQSSGDSIYLTNGIDPNPTNSTLYLTPNSTLLTAGDGVNTASSLTMTDTVTKLEQVISGAVKDKLELRDESISLITATARGMYLNPTDLDLDNGSSRITLNSNGITFSNIGQSKYTFEIAADGIPVKAYGEDSNGNLTKFTGTLPSDLANKLDTVQTGAQSVVSTVDFDGGILVGSGYFGPTSPNIVFDASATSYILDNPDISLTIRKQYDNNALASLTMAKATPVDGVASLSSNGAGTSYSNINLFSGSATTPTYQQFTLENADGGGVGEFEFIGSSLDIQNINPSDGSAIKVPNDSWIRPQTENSGIYITNGVNPSDIYSNMGLFDGALTLRSGNGIKNHAYLNMFEDIITMGTNPTSGTGDTLLVGNGASQILVKGNQVGVFESNIVLEVGDSQIILNNEGTYFTKGISIGNPNPSDGSSIKVPDNSWIRPQTAQSSLFLTNGTNPSTTNSTLDLSNGLTQLSVGDGTTQFGSFQMSAGLIGLLYNNQMRIAISPTETSILNPAGTDAMQIDDSAIKIPDNYWIRPQTAQQSLILTNGTNPSTTNSTLQLNNGSTLISAGDGTTQTASLQMDASNITLLQGGKPILDATPTETTLFNPSQAGAFQIDSTYNWNYLKARFTDGIEVLLGGVDIADTIDGIPQTKSIKIPNGSFIGVQTDQQPLYISNGVNQGPSNSSIGLENGDARLSAGDGTIIDGLLTLSKTNGVQLSNYDSGSQSAYLELLTNTLKLLDNTGRGFSLTATNTEISNSTTNVSLTPTGIYFNGTTNGDYEFRGIPTATPSFSVGYDSNEKLVKFTVPISGGLLVDLGMTNSDQTITVASGATIINFDDTVTGAIDKNGDWDNTNKKFVVSSTSGSGTYQFEVNLFAQNNTSGYYNLQAFINGTIKSPNGAFAMSDAVDDSNFDGVAGTISLDLVVGDEVEIKLQSYNATTTISANGTWNFAQGIRISKASGIKGDKGDTGTGAPVSLSKTLTLQEPTASDNITVFRTDVAITVQEVIACSTGTTPSTTYQLKHSTDRSVAGNALTASAVTTSTTTGDIASLSDVTIPANSWVWLETTIATGISVYLTIDIRYTED